MAENKRPLKVEVAVIGAGSAGISAYRKLKRDGVDAVLIDPGPLGTTCARVGCMPSKALISVAKDYHRRTVFEREGIRGSDQLVCDVPAVLRHVRTLRDHFSDGMVRVTKELAGDRLIRERATLRDIHTIETEHFRIVSEKIIIATGARPKVPAEWQVFGDRILTSESVFEQQDMPQRLAVIGLKLEGLELGQALARLGGRVACFGRNKKIGGVTDPVINRALHQIIGAEVPIYSGAEARVRQNSDGSLTVEAGTVQETVDGLLLCMGVIPNLDRLGMDRLGLDLDDNGIPPYDPQTGRIVDLPIYLSGDVNTYRPVLHEALDEGFIAGFNAAAEEPACAERRVPIRICFSDPQAVVVGQSWEQLQSEDIAVGTVDFSEESRATLEQRDAGCLRVYADPETGRLLGSEMAAPDAEHLGHLIALAIQQRLSVNDLLKIPFYHPTITEALRSALRDIAQQGRLKVDHVGLELGSCSPEKPLE